MQAYVVSCDDNLHCTAEFDWVTLCYNAKQFGLLARWLAAGCQCLRRIHCWCCSVALVVVLIRCLHKCPDDTMQLSTSTSASTSSEYSLLHLCYISQPQNSYNSLRLTLPGFALECIKLRVHCIKYSSCRYTTKPTNYTQRTAFTDDGLLILSGFCFVLFSFRLPFSSDLVRYWLNWLSVQFLSAR